MFDAIMTVLLVSASGYKVSVAEMCVMCQGKMGLNPSYGVSVRCPGSRNGDLFSPPLQQSAVRPVEKMRYHDSSQTHS